MKKKIHSLKEQALQGQRISLSKRTSIPETQIKAESFTPIEYEKVKPFTSNEVAREVSLDGGGGRRREVSGVGDDEGPGLVVEGGLPRRGPLEWRRL